MTKLIVFAVLIVGGVLLLLGKLYKSLMVDPGRKAAEVQSGKPSPGPASTPAPGQPAKVEEKPRRSPVRFVRETYAFYSDSRRMFHEGAAWLRTQEGGMYVQGEASEFGVVEAVRCVNLGRAYAVAKCNDGGGQIVYVVASAAPEKFVESRIANTVENPPPASSPGVSSAVAR